MHVDLLGVFLLYSRASNLNIVVLGHGMVFMLPSRITSFRALIPLVFGHGKYLSAGSVCIQLTAVKRGVETHMNSPDTPRKPFNDAADSESEDEGGGLLAEHETDDEEPTPKGPKVPHRWRVTIMMAVAFVLCNMDKVCFQYRPFLSGMLLAL